VSVRHRSLLAVILSVSARVVASDQTQEGDDLNSEVWQGLMSSFALPWAELLSTNEGSEGNALSARVAFDYPLKGGTAATSGSGSQGSGSGSSTAQLALRYSPLSYWFGSATAFGYLQSQYRATWSPDFSYSFGYDDWHPYTLSLVYSNGGGNRFHADRATGERHTRFEQGGWSLGYKFPLRGWARDVFTTGHGDLAGCITAFNYTARYSDLASGSVRADKKSFSMGCRYSLRNWLYATAALYYYPEQGHQQPWDPDFTYGFGYFNWRPGTVSIQYNNFAGNRAPWRRSGGATRFSEGSVSVSWSMRW